MKSTNLLIVLTASILFFGCEKIIKDSEVPAFIHIDSFQLNSEYAVSGSNSHEITDAWIYLDDQFLGSYELPATFPVIASDGDHKILVTPGVKMNGISATRIQYPFYTSHIDTISLTADSITPIEPIIEYREGLSYEWLEDFEAGGDSWIIDAVSDTNMITTSIDSLVYEGSSSGHIFLHDTLSFFEIQSANDFLLPTNGTPIFMELDHKTILDGSESENHFLAIGLIAYKASTIVQTEPVIWINSKEDWRKTYVNLTAAVSSHSDAFAFKIYIGTTKVPGSGNFELLLDNLKLIHQ